jgi:transglutaminase-like putative cysteine protease
MKLHWSIFLLSLITACIRQPGEINLPERNNPEPISEEQRFYSVHQTLSLVNQGSGQPVKQNLWVALIRSVPPYQEVTERLILPSEYDLISDEFGNLYAEFDFSNHPPGTTQKVEISYKIKVNELEYDLSSCTGELRTDFIEPELHIESANPQIVALSESLSLDASSPCEQVRAFYDYAGDELHYTYNHEDWGAQATLGEMGADCTEYSSLVIALSRAAGIPARYYEGILYLGDQPDGIAKIEHAWLEVYLPGVGWTPLDPTLGRGSLFRESHFAHYSLDHIIVTTGRNPSTLRGSNYWSHLYWPGDSTTIRVEGDRWLITPVE